MLQDKKTKKIFILEGNIGAGKSTLLRMIENNFKNVGIIFESVDKWQHVGEEGNLLDLFYKDIKRWSYTFQSYAFISRIQSNIDFMRKNPNLDTIFVERSVYSDRYCFAKNCFESGFMSALEWQIYREWFSWIVETYMQVPFGFIYLKTTPETCFTRMKKRKRSEENDVSLDYLNLLHNKHEDWLVHKKDISKSLASVPVISLDCDKEFETSLEVQKMHMIKLNAFIKSVDQKSTEKSGVVQKQI